MAMPWKLVKKYGGICFDMICCLVEFWDEQKETPVLVLSVEVYCRSHWTANHLSEAIIQSFEKTHVISIKNTYHINRTDVLFNTINNIHHMFQK
jgi:hypothetical protein